MSMSANIEEVERMEGHKKKGVFFDLWLFVAFMVQYINSWKELSAAMEQKIQLTSIQAFSYKLIPNDNHK